MKLPIYIFAILLLFTGASCNLSVTSDNLSGKWKYIKVENPHANPPDTLTATDIRMRAPYIQFTDKTLTIVWVGQVLSHGTYKMNGKKVMYTEALPDGKTRQFPFYVSKLTDKELIFETLGKDGTRITAVKVQ